MAPLPLLSSHPDRHLIAWACCHIMAIISFLLWWCWCLCTLLSLPSCSSTYFVGYSWVWCFFGAQIVLINRINNINIGRVVIFDIFVEFMTCVAKNARMLLILVFLLSNLSRLLYLASLYFVDRWFFFYICKKEGAHFCTHTWHRPGACRAPGTLAWTRRWGLRAFYARPTLRAHFPPHHGASYLIFLDIQIVASVRQHVVKSWPSCVQNLVGSACLNCYSIYSLHQSTECLQQPFFLYPLRSLRSLSTLCIYLPFEGRSPPVTYDPYVS